MSNIPRATRFLGATVLGLKVGLDVRIFQDTDRSGLSGGPYLVADLAGDVAGISIPIRDPLPLSNQLKREFDVGVVPTPIGKVGIVFHLEVDDYNWKADEENKNDGTATFKIVGIAVLSVGLVRVPVHLGSSDVVLMISGTTEAVMTGASLGQSVVERAAAYHRRQVEDVYPTLGSIGLKASQELGSVLATR